MIKNKTCFLKIENIVKYFALVVVILIIILPLFAQETNSTDDTQWFALFLNGRKSGYMKATRTEKNNHIETTMITDIELNRGSMLFKYRESVTTVETINGKPLSFRKEKSSSGMVVTLHGTVGPDGRINLETDTNGRKSKKVVDWPKGALMPEAVRLIEQKQGLKKGTKYSVQVFSADPLCAINTDITIGGTSNVDLLGKIVPLIEIKQNLNFMGIKTSVTVYTARNHEMQKMIMSMMGMEMLLIACPEQYALSKNEPTDFFTAFFVRSPKKLSTKDLSGKISYEIDINTTRAGQLLPATDEQNISAMKSSKNHYRVTVRNLTMPAHGTIPYNGNDSQAIEALKSSAYVQSDAVEIINLAKKAVGHSTDAAEAAKIIETFVGNYIHKKNLAVGYASALDVAKSREG